MTNQPTNTTRKSLFFTLCLAFAGLLFACDKPQADKTAKPAAQAATSATQAENTASGGMPNITDEDMGNLVRAMHGAASQQPDDAPKDKYGQPYIIGNLGGVPVNLPSSVVRLVEYDDSPGWDFEKLRTYRPPTRSYQSIIMSFGFEINYADKELFDYKKNLARHRKEEDMPGSHWIDVGVSNIYQNNKIEDILDSYVADDIENSPNKLPRNFYEPTGEKQFGLSVYASPGIDPETGKPWRENLYAEDVFVHWNEQGHVDTYIKCYNGKVPQPPCTHYFTLDDEIKLSIDLSYDRYVLHDWKQIEDAAKEAIYGFMQ